MKKILFSFLALLPIFFSPCAHGGQTIIGNGSMLCETYLQSDDVVKLAAESWALGFISSANMRSKNIDLLTAINSVAVIDAVENFCGAQPSENITNATIHVLLELVASADEDCTEKRNYATRSRGLNHCDNPASVENNGEPAGWSMTVPAVE